MGLEYLDIITPQRLLYNNPYYTKKAKTWDLPEDSMIVFDEAHAGISGENTKTGEAIARTKIYGIPILLLSATISDSPLKMRAIGWLLGLHKWSKSSYRSWCRDMGCYNSPFVPGKLEFSKGAKGRDAIKQIATDIAPFSVRISHEDIPNFPENFLHVELFDLETKYLKEIKTVEKELDARLAMPRSNELAERTRVCEITELNKVCLLADLTQAALDEGTSPVVFVKFHSTREALVAELADRKITDVSQVHGKQTKQDERDLNMAAFQDNTNHVCIVTIATGVGINLHDVHHKRKRVAILCPGDSAVHMLQCLGRIHRSGGTDTMQTIVLAAGTLEEKIYRNLKRKLTNIQMINDGLALPLTDADLAT